VALNALGLGELQSSSQLNQPLNAQIELLSTNAKEVGQLRVKLASADVFNRVGIDRPAYLNSLTFRTATQNGKPVILVSSAQPVQEPFLNFLLEVSWPQGQLLKEYTVLLDPPVLMQAGDAAPQNTASVRAEPKSSGVVNRANKQQNQQQASQAKTVQASTLEAEAKIAEQEEKQRARLVGAAKPVATSSRASGGKKYRVRRGDTMQKVTSRLRYPGVTSSQMMIALFKANPHAFAKNNINYLKTGEVLTQPSRTDVSSSSKSAARSQIKQHYAAWKQYRKGLSSKTVAQKSVVANDTKTSTVENAAKAVNNKNASKTDTNTAKLSVVGSKAEAINSNDVSGSGSPELQKKLALAEEALASTSSKNAELETRVGKLEAIVRKKDRLITLKNERLSRLESQLANAGVANTDKPRTDEAVAVNPVSVASVNEAEDLATSVGNEADQKDNVIIRNDDINSENISGVVENASASSAEKTTAMLEHETVAEKSANDQPATSPFVDNKTEEGGLLDLLKSPLVAMIGGGSLLTLILGGLFLRRRQALAAEADNEFIDSGHDDFDLTDESFDAGFDPKRDEYSIKGSNDSVQDHTHKTEATGEIRDTGEDELDKVLSADASLDDDEVLQEADVYIVYGLHEQAEEELKKAIAEKPSKLEYRYKLLENYQMADDSKAFVASAKDFLKAEGDNKQELWEKIVELGKKVAPENDMFAEKSSTKAATVFAGVAAAAAVTAGLATSGVLAGTDKIDDNLSMGMNDSVSSEEFESLLNADSGFDDLDLLDVNATAEKSHNLDLPDEANISLGDTTLDDELKDDLDLSEFSDLGADDKFDFEGLDNLEGLGGLEELGALDGFETDNSNVLNFKDVESTIANDSASLNLEIDSSSGLDKVLPTGSYSSELSSLSDDDDDNDALSFLNLPDDDQEMQDAHIGTKLDLARAYLDMGDVEGARCTLEEVVIEGNAAQKREAEEMLQQTG
jgi:pilus assembly protein FimV